MKKKILYSVCTATICVTSFFVGNTIGGNKQNNINTKIDINTNDSSITIECNAEKFHISSEELERAGLISTSNIIDWNTNGEELSVMTNNGYEWYAYKSKDVYKNHNYISIDKNIF